MLNLNSFMIGSENPKVLVEFYKKVFDKKPEMEDEGWTGFMVGSSFFSIGFHDKVKGKSKNPERMMFNLETKDVKKEFARIKKLGAKPLGEPYQVDPNMPNFWIATFEDPDGNYFQLMSPWDDGKK